MLKAKRRVGGRVLVAIEKEQVVGRAVGSEAGPGWRGSDRRIERRNTKKKVGVGNNEPCTGFMTRAYRLLSYLPGSVESSNVLQAACPP